MKNKLLTFLAALAASAGFSVGVQAQTLGDIIFANGHKYSVGANLITNPSFDDGVTGWTNGAGSALTTAAGFTINTTGGSDGGSYLVGTANGGSTATSSIRTGWRLTSNKTYLFYYYVKTLSSTIPGTGYLKTSLTNTLGTETSSFSTPVVDASWKQYKVVFQNTTPYSYIQCMFRWLNNQWAFDNFCLAELTELPNVDSLQVKITEAQAAYSESADGAVTLNDAIITAQDCLSNSAATVSEVAAAISALDTALFNYRIANASNASPVDVTKLLSDPDMAKGTSSAWKNVVGDKAYSVNSSSYTGFTGTFLEKWTAQGTTFNALADFDITQTITNLPNGLYTLKAYCIATQQGKTGSEQKTYVQNVSLYANAASTSVATISGTPELFTVANASVIDGTLKVGYKSVSGTANWIAFDNCTLTYLGFDPAAMIATLQTQKDEATLNLVGKYMQTSVATELDGAINQATTAIGLATKTALEDAGARLGSAINAATASIASYVALNAAIAAADASPYTNISGYSDYLAAISSTQNLYDARTIDDATIATAITTLKAAEFICLETAPNFTTSIQNSDITNGPTGWTVAKGSGNGPTNSGEGNGLYLDSWASNWTTGFSATQTLSLPNGTYIASAYARAAVANVAALKLNDVKTYAKSSTWGTILAKTTVTDGTLAIGVVSETFSGSYWFSFDDFKLYRVDVPYVVAVTDKAASVKGAIDDAAVTEIGSALANATSADFSKAKANSAKTIPNANPNLIAYNVPANVTVENAITAGCTKELTESYPFYAPTALTMTVSYVRSFTAASGDNVSGWQSIVVPFNVTAITATQDGNTITLVPFSAWDQTTESTSARPFWLYKANGTTYEKASSIDANVPYLISIPNDPSYADFYNVSGSVTFTGTALAVTSTTEGTLSGLGYHIVPNFDGSKAGIYALNAAGSQWESGKSVNSFHAYATAMDASAPKFISIFGDAETTGIKDILSETTMADKTVSAFTTEGGITIVSKNPGKVAIYTDGGLLLKVVPVGEGSNFVALGSGKYIVNATVVIVK